MIIINTALKRLEEAGKDFQVIEITFHGTFDAYRSAEKLFSLKPDFTRKETEV